MPRLPHLQNENSSAHLRNSAVPERLLCARPEWVPETHGLPTRRAVSRQVGEWEASRRQPPGSLVITARDVITVRFTRFCGRLFVVGLSTRLSPPDDGWQGTVSPGPHCPPVPGAASTPQGCVRWEGDRLPGRGTWDRPPGKTLRPRVSSHRKTGHLFFLSSWLTPPPSWLPRGALCDVGLRFLGCTGG